MTQGPSYNEPLNNFYPYTAKSVYQETVIPELGKGISYRSTSKWFVVFNAVVQKYIENRPNV
jgi:hypothetical protein